MSQSKYFHVTMPQDTFLPKMTSGQPEQFIHKNEIGKSSFHHLQGEKRHNDNDNNYLTRKQNDSSYRLDYRLSMPI